MHTSADYTIDELICVCISRQIKDETMVAQGIATPLAAAGYLLAKLTHAPNLVIASAIGQSLCMGWAPLGISTIENLWIKKGVLTFGFVTGACDLLPSFGPLEFFRPGQVDAHGNFNNVFMGGTYKRPRLRLPGSGGIPDVTVFEENVCLYVPRHGRHTFVPELDFCSGLGHVSARKSGNGPTYLVSNLGQFDFGGENGRLRLRTLHNGVTLAHIQKKTGFAFDTLSKITTTTPPTTQELTLLRNKIDPFDTRKLETLSGARRRKHLRTILEQEKAAKRQSSKVAK
ncbi:MAG: hypothetical protein GY943_35160 [Chloroflexi bacterium]|nr:hypothetical protein [Chloroflexota bacterium]